MKITLSLSTLLSLSLLTAPAKELTSVQKLGLGGNVKSYTIYNSNGDQSAETRLEEYHFDGKGNLTSHTVYDKGEIATKTESAIDKKGKIVGERTVSKNGEERIKTNIYDKKGRLITTTTLLANNMPIQTDTFIYYRKKRKKQQITMLYPHGPLKINNYDKKGRLTRCVKLMPNQPNQYINEQYTYNKNGDIEQSVRISDNLKKGDTTKADTTVTIWKYNGFKHLYSKITYRNKKQTEKWDYSCDGRGCKTEEFHYIFDAPKGNIGYDLTEHLKDYHKYRYDDHGNKSGEWHYSGKEIEFTGGKIYEITYYK